MFAGYGVTSKEHRYDDYAELDVKGKVVLAMRFEPHDGERQEPVHGSEELVDRRAIVEKAKTAADHGAAACCS